ncbi:MAG: HAMP domain-containing histidine kinase [Chloroflexi bacterium]|nr:HAMP domain-containing histidine kinase [Chloroflexota bacterium]
MNMIKRWIRRWWGTLRFKLIGWYVVLLVLTLVAFSGYIFFQFQELEQRQQDTKLQAALSSIRGWVDQGPPPIGGILILPPTTSDLHFRSFPGSQAIIQDLNRGNIQVRLLNQTGQVSDSLGNLVSEMPFKFPANSGFATLTATDQSQWRVFTQPLGSPENSIGWIQVGQPIFLLNAELGNLFTPILLGTLLAMLFAVLGGLFLANQALRPIDRVTRMAQSIGTHDLSQRINYRGPADEIGRLTKTLDQMLERLEKGFEQERRFTSDASHELRTPLTALKGRIEVTLNRSRTTEDYEQTLRDLGGEVDRLVRLSNSLLYLARLDQADQSSQAETLNLSDLLESIVDSMQPVAELKQIRLEGNLPLDLHLGGNLDQLTRLFLNLVDNAIKYTPEGGEITVRAEKEAKVVRVSISDNGPGIAAEHLPHLFKRFYRAESDRASSSGGAGLGLAIANEIARQHGGTLEVKSQLSQGTTFSVQLPLPEASDQK